MITNKAKEEACIAFKAYLKLIYWMGRGVMLTIHVQRFMEIIEKKNKSKVCKDLRELQEKEIIDIHKIHNNNYVKLKKYAFRYLLEKDRSEDTKSITYNLSTIKKSAFISEYILEKYKWKANTIDELISECYYNTTLLNKDKNNAAILKNCVEINDAIREEIENLDTLATQQLRNLKTKTAGLKVQKLNSFNLNNMQSRNIYISSITENKITVLFFDMSDKYTTQKLAEVFQKVYDYLFLLFDKKKFHFKIIATDAQSVLRLKKQKESLMNILQNKKIYGSFNVNIINLDIRAKAFGNVRILL